MDYIFRITACLTHRNNRDRHVYESLNRFNMYLIDSCDLSAFKSHLKDVVKVENETYPRCKPMEVSFLKYDDKSTVVHFDKGHITCRIEKIKGLYKTEA